MESVLYAHGYRPLMVLSRLGDQGIDSCQCATKTLTPAQIQHALQTVEPEFFYTVKVCPDHTFLCPTHLLFRKGNAAGCNMFRQNTLIFWTMPWM